MVEQKYATGERRVLLDGDAPFPEDAEGIIRIGTSEQPGWKHDLVSDTRPDSMVELRLPSVEIDSDSVFRLALWFFTGPNPLVLLRGEALPRATLEYVFVVVESTLKEADWDKGRYLDLAEEVDYMGLWILRKRVRQTEQSVRDALSDEEFTTPDLEALREYPIRLAHIEVAARALRRRPKVESAKPERLSPFDRLAPPPQVGTRFVDYVDEVEKDARDAVARLSGLISSQQIVLTKRQALETARFQRMVTIFGAAVVVPGLVAAIFGANVGFQGRESTQAFWAMLLLMAGSALGGYAAIRLLEAGAWAWITQHRPVSWLNAVARLTALALLVSVITQNCRSVITERCRSIPQAAALASSTRW